VKTFQKFLRSYYALPLLFNICILYCQNERLSTFLLPKKKIKKD
jgi:hypothetical protein